MKKILLLSILLSGYASSQEFEFNIPMINKPHEVIKFSAEQGKTYNWDRCSGQTTQALSEDGVACEKVINSRSGFTGSVDVCVSATKENLSDPYCFAMCQGESVTWGNCTASVTLSEHLDIKNITNTDNRYVGTAEMLCTDGNWSIRSSTCEDNLPICGSDHNTVNNNPSNLCEIGSASSVTSNANTMNWNCTTSANNIACLSYKVALCDSNTFNGCIVGTSGGYTSAIGASTATWNCVNGTSSVGCYKQIINQGTKGHLDGVYSHINGQAIISGWGCDIGKPWSAPFHIYIGGPVGIGTFFKSINPTANTEAAIYNICGDTGQKHRFLLIMSASEVTNYSGKYVFIYVIPHGDSANSSNIIGASGIYKIP